MIVSAGGNLTHTSFPRDILDDLVATVSGLRSQEESGNRFYFQSLSGRAVSGNTATERWDQLLRLLQSQRIGQSAPHATDSE